MAHLSRSQPWRRPSSGGVEILREFADGLIYAAGYLGAPLGQSDGSAYFGRGDVLSNNLAQQRGSMHGFYVGDIPPRVSTPYGPALQFSGTPSGGIVSKLYTQSIVGASNGAAADESCVVVCSLGSSTGSQSIMGFANIWSTSLADYGRGIGVEGGQLMAWGASAQNGKKILATLPDLNKPVVIAARFGVNGCLMVDGRVVATGDTSHSWGYNLSVGIAAGLSESATTGSFNGTVGPRHWWRKGLSDAQLLRASELAYGVLQPRRRRLFVVASGLSTVTTDASAAFAIRTAAQVDRAAAYAVRTSAQADAAASFVLRTNAASDAVASFVVRTAAQADNTAAFAVRTVAQVDLAAAFTIGAASVTKDTTAAYAVRAAVQANSAAAYAVRTSALGDTSAAYVVRGAAQVDQVASFTVRTAAQADLAGAFSVVNAGVVVTDLGASFSLRAAAQADTAAAFAIRTAAQVDRAASYTVRGAASADLVGAFAVINTLSATADLVASWGVAGSLLRDLSVSYSIQGVEIPQHVAVLFRPTRTHTARFRP